MTCIANPRNLGLPLLSVVMPVYNEITTIHEIILRVLSVDVDKELIIVDDCSTDGTREYLKALAISEAADHAVTERRRPLRIFFQDRNYGKCAALRRGFEQAIGQIVVIQDADLELNPQEYGKLIEPIQLNLADVVYGSRFLGKNSQGVATPNYWANRLLTAASNIFTGLHLTDVWTGHKTFKREILDGIELRENSFAFEPEFTAKMADMGSAGIVFVPHSKARQEDQLERRVSGHRMYRLLWPPVPSSRAEPRECCPQTCDCLSFSKHSGTENSASWVATLLKTNLSEEMAFFSGGTVSNMGRRWNKNGNLE